MSVSYKVIGRHIQEARKRMKLTQREIAEKLNMSDTYYGKIERGECRTNLERLAQISVLLNVPLEDLISGGIAHVDKKGNVAVSQIVDSNDLGTRRLAAKRHPAL